MNKILVVGSSNIDMVARVSYLPKAGETVGGAQFMQVFGGKGANQAVAAARLGGVVNFVTALGDDAIAAELLTQFDREGIDTQHIVTIGSCPTGTALIFVADNAENCIVVAPGANGQLDKTSLASLDALLEDQDVVLLQAEIPYETIKYVAGRAHCAGVKVILNPAPACKLDAELMSFVDLLVVNETEAETISELNFDSDGLDSIASKLLQMGTKGVVVTLGKRGACYIDRNQRFNVEAYVVEAVDTTAAGDTFCGALAVKLNEQGVTKEALRFCCAASALAVTKMGAQPSMPYLAEVVKFYDQN